MSQTPLYPMRFDPIYEYRPWGGSRLAGLLNAPQPVSPGAVGEAWILSDREDHPSIVANGPLQGQTIAQLIGHSSDQLMGRLAHRFERFPLLLKFLDAHQMLSMQVHPSGDAGKTEAWVVLEAGSESLIYAGLKPGNTAASLRQALSQGAVADDVLSFTPKAGDAVFLPGGTVHSLGGDVVVFEIQQNSDVTFRLFDWDHIDSSTGKTRPLQVAQALSSINYDGNAKCGLTAPVVEATTPVVCERLFQCDYFWLWRMRGASPFMVGCSGVPHVVVCTEGAGQIEQGNASFSVQKGEVWLLPSSVGPCVFRPSVPVTLLEIAAVNQTST